jgi:hypothetical protein
MGADMLDSFGDKAGSAPDNPEHESRDGARAFLVQVVSGPIEAQLPIPSFT